ncbi:uncharacterized protein EI97DRAFT_415643 [Westerdykella ornata]|uniref:Geranylgeranyl pyrophosphate synthetase n=1 Tax=Westerdykella ornata TaxID=318751 RepID=A0A6A6JN22_WESOR|nr:uncharacterized protein EI97DRAFT_415643 [Westerdykella ornata]KAF2277902.1 hypothetical protein EI97DRAFT_415643 [Westerdykella ornata]
MAFTGRSGSSRRGGSGSRGGRGGYSRINNRHKYPKPDLSKDPLGGLITTISNSDLTNPDGAVENPEITECAYIASYTWTNEASPTIVVPGKPPLWTPPHGPQQLREDEGEFFRDPNAARFPVHPTEPAVRTILKYAPGYPTSSINIFACGSTLGHLLRFVRHVDKPFRFKVELIGNTVFFARQENSPKELIRDIRGFGHTFPDAYTTWEADVKGSETHQRMIQYMFGGLKCIVRFECDGYFRPSKSDDSAPESAIADVKPAADDDLAEALRVTSVSHDVQIIDGGDSLRIKTGGQEIPQSSIFDLKTRSGKYKKEIDMTDLLPMLYLKQIPNFIVAYHDGAGLFRPDDIKTLKLTDSLRRWEIENKAALQRLAILLHKLIDIAKNDARGLLDVYCPGPDRLEIHTQHGEGSPALPLVLKEEWAGRAEGKDADSEFSDGERPALRDDNVECKDDDRPLDSDSDDDDRDFTACSADSCGYCGKCSY